MRAPLAGLAAAALLLGLALSPASAVDAPLTNEDIVRLAMHGTSESAILRAIAENPVDFDLEAEIVHELRSAGVAEAIIEAMRRRQAAMTHAPDPSPAGPAGAAAARGTLHLTFAGDTPDAPGAAGEIFAVRTPPRGVVAPGGMEVGRAADLALAILCTTADHVPDHWDTITPIQGAPRHRVVLFRPGSRPGRVKGFEVLFLNRDPVEPAALPAGSHDLIVGLAGQVPGSDFWRLLAADAAHVQVDGIHPTRLALRADSRMRGNRMTGFSVEQQWDITVEPAAEGS
jgi:hypothetical protein